jgi:hypothetical protein
VSTKYADNNIKNGNKGRKYRGNTTLELQIKKKRGKKPEKNGNHLFEK